MAKDDNVFGWDDVTGVLDTGRGIVADISGATAANAAVLAEQAKAEAAGISATSGKEIAWIIGGTLLAATIGAALIFKRW